MNLLFILEYIDSPSATESKKPDIVLSAGEFLFLTPMLYYKIGMGRSYIIVSPDESRGYLGFSTVAPPQRFPFGCSNLKHILVRPFKFGM